MKKKLLLGISLVALLLSCGEKNIKSTKVDASKFPREWVSDKPALPKDGLINKDAYVLNGGFEGILNPHLYTNAADFAVLSPLYPALFFTSADFEIIDGGMANISFDDVKNTVTYKLRNNLVWEDGHPLTVDDIIFTYELIAHPDYTGVRFTDEYRGVKGIMDYHYGKAKKISGLKKISDTELVVEMEELGPAMLTGSGIIVGLSPKHYLEGIPVGELEQNEKIRLHPLGYGAFKMVDLIPGESAKYVPNENYWDKENIPQVQESIFKVIPPSSALTSVKNGEYDTYKEMPEEAILNIENLDNIVLLGTPALYYSYIGFKLGKYDRETGTTTINENAKLKDIRVRQAMAYAVDMASITKHFFNDIHFPANGVVPPIFKKYYSDEINGYAYNPEKAKQLLDEAGFKDVDGDGYRENPQGEKLVINFAMPNFDKTAEPIGLAYIQFWKEVGLNVQLYNGRLIDTANYFKLVQSDDPEVDIFRAAWGVGTALNPSALYTKDSPFNYSRYSTPENEELIKEANNPKYLLDKEGKRKAFINWHKNYIDNVLGFLPQTFKVKISPVNKRVKKATTYTGSEETRYPLQLTNAETIK